jgi:hypothetical protein
MLSLFAFALGLVMVVTAAKVDRTARGGGAGRAVLLNLAGMSCFLLGVVVLCGGGRHHAGTLPWRGVARGADLPRAIVVPLLDEGQTPHAADAATGEAERESMSTTVTRHDQAEALPEVASQSAETLTALQPAETRPLDEAVAESEETAASVPLEIGSKVEIDYEARPSWVERADTDLGNVHYISVASGPYLRPREARQELHRQLKQVTDEYINEYLRHAQAARWVGYDEQEIRRRFLASDGLFEDRVLSPSFGVMHQAHALLALDAEFHDEIDASWHRARARAQLVKVALASGVVLGMLTMLFGYFRMDTATRGFYSGRLKFVTGAAILAVIAVALLLARAIPWLWL